MHEPPILPPNVQNDASPAADPSDNPFAPTAQVGQLLQPGQPRVDLPPLYWICLILATLVFVFATYTSGGLLLPGLIAILAAAVRVPLIQRRLTRARAGVRLPHSLLMLLASWAISLMGVLASFIAFVVICVPTGILFMTGSNSEQGIVVAIGLSGLVSVVAFLCLFMVSLRLPC